MWRCLIVVWVAGFLVGCKDEAACERQRLELNKAWAELHSAATRQKLTGAELATWTELEAKTELLESSFMTRQVTWESAKQASDAVASKLDGLRATGDARLTGFINSAESALAREREFEKQCH